MSYTRFCRTRSKLPLEKRKAKPLSATPSQFSHPFQQKIGYHYPDSGPTPKRRSKPPVTTEVARALVVPAIKGASTACGLVLGGFLGGAAGGMVGAAFGRLAGEALGELGKKVTEAAIEKGSEYFVDKSAEPLIDGFRKSHPTLKDIYREAFRLSLFSIRPDLKTTALNLSSSYGGTSVEYLDWFENWDDALRKGVALNLEGLDLPDNDLQADPCFKAVMERIDAQGGTLRGKAVREGKKFSVEYPSDLPDALLAFLKARLPDLFVQFYKDQLVKEENRTAFNEKELRFQEQFVSCFGRLEEKVDAIREAQATQSEKIDAIREAQATQSEKFDAFMKMLGGRFDAGIEAGSVPVSAVKERDAMIARQAEEIEALGEQISARAARPPQAGAEDAEISKALADGDLDAALRLKTDQVKCSGEEAERDLYELGTIHEARFEWPQALAAYRKAWEMGKDPNHGFKYALFSQELNKFDDAIAAYEELLSFYTDPVDVAMTLSNLAILYSRTQRIQKAEEAYGEALAIKRKLAEANPDAYLPKVAMTLNNLAILYSRTQRIQKAEEAYGEALAAYRNLAEANPDAYLPYVAATLNNLAILYSGTQRIQKAEGAYEEAPAAYRKLAEANPDAYLPDFAMILNNLANLYSRTQRIQKAEEAYGEALAAYRKLAEANPDANLPYVASTLNNLAILYSGTQRIQKAEGAYEEALAAYRKLAEANPDAYLPDFAMILNNLANLYYDTQRIQKAEEAYGEALAIKRKLAEANPDRSEERR